MLNKKILQFSSEIMPLDNSIKYLANDGDFYYYETESRRIFWNTLSYFIPQINKRPVKNIEKILSLGCGPANEFPVLASYFSGGGCRKIDLVINN